jgi:hypothetical protein
MTNPGDRTQVGFWSALQRDRDKSDAERINGKDLSHRKRIAEVARVLGLSPASRVLDLGAGIGLLERWHGPFREYVAIDFCPEYVEEIRETARSPLDARVASVLEVDYAALPEADAAVMCGVTSIPGLFPSLEALFDLLAPLTVRTRTLITFMWSGWPEFSDGTRTWGLDEVRAELGRRRLRGSFHFGHLPHEFLCVIEPGGPVP